MDGLDPCIGVGFLIKNKEDLKKFEEAFRGNLSNMASIFTKRPT